MEIKKIAPVAAALIIAALGAYMYYNPVPQLPLAPNSNQQESIAVRIGTTTIFAEVVQSNEARAKGLGGRTSLAEGSGMWFVFEQDGLWGFWMKDTLIPLDMLWVATDGTIVTIAHNVRPESFPQVYKPTAPARYVLELPGGYAKRHGIAEGDKIVVQ